jgi:hypothetical protein
MRCEGYYNWVIRKDWDADDFWGKLAELSASVAVNMAEIQTRYFPNTDLESYRCSSLVSVIVIARELYDRGLQYCIKETYTWYIFKFDFIELILRTKHGRIYGCGGAPEQSKCGGSLSVTTDLVHGNYISFYSYFLQ